MLNWTVGSAPLLWVASGAALLALAAAAPVRAATLTEDFSGASGSYTLTVLDDGASALAAGPGNGRLEITGSVAAGSEPKVILQPHVALRAGDSWSVEASILMRHDLLAPLAARDSLQAWISVGSSVDGDDDVRAKSGLVKGSFSVGGITVDDGFFVSSGYLLDDDSLTGSGTTTEYSYVDPAAAGPSATLTTTLRIEYDAALGELTTLYRLGGGPFLAYPLEDGSGNPAPILDPLGDWMLAPDDALEISLMFSATQAASFGGGSADIGSSFSLASGDVFFDDLTVTGTLLPIPEPSSALLLASGLAMLALLAATAKPTRDSSESNS